MESQTAMLDGGGKRSATPLLRMATKIRDNSQKASNAFVDRRASLCLNSFWPTCPRTEVRCALSCPPESREDSLPQRSANATLPA